MLRTPTGRVAEFGLRHSTRNRTLGKTNRGFESHPFRHFFAVAGVVSERTRFLVAKSCEVTAIEKLCNDAQAHCLPALACNENALRGVAFSCNPRNTSGSGSKSKVVSVPP